MPFNTCDDCGTPLPVAPVDKDFNFNVPWCHECGLLADNEGLKRMTTPQVITWFKRNVPGWRYSQLRQLSKLLETTENTKAIKMVMRGLN